MFRFTKLHLEQYRCLETLDLDLESDLTVLFAENGGGKTAVLTVLAVGLTPFQSGTPRGLKLDPQCDPRKVTLDERGRREPAGSCTLAWTADVGARTGVSWSSTVNPASNRKSSNHRSILDAMEQVRVPGARWPLFALYGVDRMGHGKASTKPAPSRPDRWEGYVGSLNAAQDDSALLTWLLEEILADTVRRQEGEAERFLASAVLPPAPVHRDDALTCDCRKHEDPLRAADGDPDLPWPVDHAYEHCVGFTSLGEIYVRSDAPLDDAQRKALAHAIGVPHDDTIKDNGILNLNHPALVAAWAAAIDSEKKRLQRQFRNRTASRAERGVIADERLVGHPLPEFVSIRAGWLRKTLGAGR